MSQTIAILDDEPDRINAMVPLLSRLFPTLHVATFDNAPDMIEWCRDSLNECVLLCLDHDLGPNRIRDDQTFDPGTGRDVVDYLATRQPACPVIIHTTNPLAAPGMEMVLQDSGWRFSRVVPYEDVTWVGEAWIQEVQEHLGRRARSDEGTAAS